MSQWTVIRGVEVKINAGQTYDDQVAHIKCARCKCHPTPEGHDACLGTLPGVKYACCGHGQGPGYVMFDTGIVIRGVFDLVNANERARLYNLELIRKIDKAHEDAGKSTLHFP